MSELLTLILLDPSKALSPEATEELQRAGYPTVRAKNLDAVIAQLKLGPRVVVLGARADQAKSAIKRIKQHSPESEVIVVDPSPSTKRSLELHNEGAFWHTGSDISPQDLLYLITRALVVTELRFQNRELRTASPHSPAVEGLVAQSKAMKGVIVQVDKAAKLDGTVLLLGESGTGKTTLARYLHQQSARASLPFVSISCAALPRDLLESELFGHERGAFTGAVKSRMGAIETAEGGTLFLDEIGELPLELQPKLLTFLQERTYRRVGASVVKRANVRLVAATNRDLKALSAQRLFREDLFFRLHVLTITVPPLRERREDLVPLIQQNLHRFATRQGVDELRMSASAQKSLLSYGWPGNVRELENVLERASAFCTGGLIDESDVATMTAPVTSSGGTWSPGMTLKQLEEHAITQALAHTNGNKAAAARALGISLKGLYNKLHAMQGM